MSSRPGSAFALVLTSAGFAYLVYLFVLACLMLSQGIPGFQEWVVIQETGSRPEAEVFAFSCLWGILPLVSLAVAALIALRRARRFEDAYLYRWHRRAAVALLVAGVPFALIAYGTWYQVGW